MKGSIFANLYLKVLMDNLFMILFSCLLWISEQRNFSPLINWPRERPTSYMSSCNRNFFFGVFVRCGQSRGHATLKIYSKKLNFFSCNFTKKIDHDYFQSKRIFLWSYIYKPANDPQIGPKMIREPEMIPTNDSPNKLGMSWIP